jgi:membrane-associated phospholipid phosphatase
VVLIRSRIHPLCILWLAGLSLLFVQEASAQTPSQSPLENTHSTGYYGGHLTATVGIAALTLLLPKALFPKNPGLDWTWFPGDQSARRRHSCTASPASDATLAMGLALPVGVQAVEGSERAFWNSQLIYLETITAQLTLNTFTKYAIRRPRPYTHQLHSGTCSAGRNRKVSSTKRFVNTDSYLSFYSGHSSTVFAAAVAGSLLVAERDQHNATSQALWAVEGLFAGTTAALRYFAGKHYPSDIMVGAVVGTAVGVLIPYAHVRSIAWKSNEIALFAGGVGAGIGLAALLSLLEPSAQETISTSKLQWTIIPSFQPQKTGLTLSVSNWLGTTNAQFSNQVASDNQLQSSFEVGMIAEKGFQ